MAPNINKLGFSTAIDLHNHQSHKSPRPFIPEIISRGGGIRGSILRLFPEKPSHHQTLMHSFTDIHADDVDTTLSLSINSITADSVSVASNSDSTVYDPMPLRWFHPMEAKPKRKRARDGGGGGRINKRGKRGVGEEDRRGPPPISKEEFEEVMQALESGNGGKAVFLYRKGLEESDVRGDQNRLFVTGGEAVMKFLTAEEAAEVDESSVGLRIVGMDKSGRGYNLVMKKWKSLQLPVIKSDWNKLVAANGAEKGDAVEIWGFRHGQDAKLGFGVVFRRKSDQ